MNVGVTIRAVPISHLLSYSFSDEKSNPNLSFKCKALPFETVEIGTKYVYATFSLSSIFSKRKHCSFFVYLKKQSEQSHEVVNTLRLPDKKGSLFFTPPFKTEFSLLSEKASIEANIFLDDKAFDDIVAQVKCNKKIKQFTIYADGDESIGYGWEPDGSRIVWNPKDDSTSFVTIDSFEIFF